jgi:hypothetical protein
MDHPISDEKIAFDFSEYTRILIKRLKDGADAYGDGSFTRPADEVAGEMAQEAIDISGWGFVLWCRISDLQKRLAKAEEWARKAKERLDALSHW